jgi:hypothetical protein
MEIESELVISDDTSIDTQVLINNIINGANQLKETAQKFEETNNKQPTTDENNFH